jgi:hypothetical protein
VWGHGVGGHDPAALAQVVRDGELVVQVPLVWVQAAGDQGQALAAGLGEDYEAEGLEGRREVVGSADQVATESDGPLTEDTDEPHDRAVALLAQADQLVVLADDLRGSAREVEGE